MDKIQVHVKDSLPEFTLTTGSTVIVMSALIWWMCFVIIHFVIVKPLMQSVRGVKGYEWTETFYKMSAKKQAYYSSYYHGVLHGVVSGLLSLYCLLYADGVPGTTWLHCSHFKLHMFDLQKYA